jgi:membrane-associated phospholipid phosphatase
MRMKNAPFPGCLAALALAFASALGSLRAEDTAVALSPSAAVERPFLRSTAREVLDYAEAPLDMRLPDLAWVLPSVAALGILIHNDVPIYDAMAKGSARQAWLDRSMPAVSALGDGLFEFSATALAAKLGGSRLSRTSATAMQGLCVVAVYSEVLKVAAWSNRPYEDDSAHRFWDFSQPSMSMPSGHTFSAFCVAEVYGDEYGRWWTYPLACLIGYSRIYNQDHWPSDVWAGCVLGVLAGVQARHATQRLGPPAIHFSLLNPSGTPMVAADVHY